ncbi:MAG: putative transcription activator [Chitinophagaceae bacterium]|nr:putative transcription activator [Chitinophagaceae bacterium]
MEIITITKDIKVFYITASAFPDGIMDAHQKLHELVPFSTARKYFGISRPENGVIVYKAATEEINPGEAEKLNCDELVLKRGNYICLTIKDYLNDIQSIGKAFKELLLYPDLDPNGYCVEWYLNNKDVKCMIRLKG